MMQNYFQKRNLPNRKAFIKARARAPPDAGIEWRTIVCIIASHH